MQRASTARQLFAGVRTALGQAKARHAAVACGGLLLCNASAADGFPSVLELSVLEPANGGDGSQGSVFARPAADVTVGVPRQVGDVNGDDLEDISAADLDGNAFVVFGRADGFPASVDLGALLPANGGDGSDGFVTRWPAIGVGDMNGDGFGDLLVGGSVENVPDGSPGARILYIVFGGEAPVQQIVDGANLLPANGGDGSEGFAVFPVDAGAPAVFSVDINGDCIDDLALGFPYANLPGRTATGRVFVLFGKTTGFAPIVELADILVDNESQVGDGLVLNGEQGTEGPPPRFYGDYAGGTLAGDDFNGDGIDDLLIGAEGARRDYVVFGKEAPLAAKFELAALAPENGGDGSAGAIVTGVIGSLGTNGHRVHVGGDVNGDGIGDIAVGQPFFNGGGAGRLYVAFGSNPLPASINVLELLPANGGDGTAGFVLQAEAYSYFGAAGIGSGDVNGDGMDELLVGLPAADPDGRTNAGSAIVVYGCNASCEPEVELAGFGAGGNAFVINGWQPGDVAGNVVSIAPDTDGDGVDDLIVGAQGADSGVGQGKVYLVRGRGVDSDSDGVADVADNCPTASNAAQRDTDQDGFGNACDADLNNDAAVNFLDLALLKSVFFCLVQNGDALCADADFTGDDFVNFDDLGVMKAGFFQPPG